LWSGENFVQPTRRAKFRRKPGIFVAVAQKVLGISKIRLASQQQGFGSHFPQIVR
jgi:hypothetical protein